MNNNAVDSCGEPGMGASDYVYLKSVANMTKDIHTCKNWFVYVVVY